MSIFLLEVVPFFEELYYHCSNLTLWRDGCLCSSSHFSLKMSRNAYWKTRLRKLINTDGKTELSAKTHLERTKILHVSCLVNLKKSTTNKKSLLPNPLPISFRYVQWLWVFAYAISTFTLHLKANLNQIVRRRRQFCLPVRPVFAMRLAMLVYFYFVCIESSPPVWNLLYYRSGWIYIVVQHKGPGWCFYLAWDSLPQRKQ